LGGAGTGAALGSAFGPIGTALGALGGGLAGLFSGRDKSYRQPSRVLPNATPQQQQLQNQSLSQALALLQGRGGLNPIAQQSQRNFYTNTVPTLAERFTAMGHSNPGTSPAFAATLGQAGSGLQQDLTAQQYGLLALLSGLGNRSENIFQPEEPGFHENLLTHLATVAPQLLGSYTAHGSLFPPSAQIHPQTQAMPPIKFPSIPGYQLGGNPFPPSHSSTLDQLLGIR
jgi:hypothetical protein